MQRDTHAADSECVRDESNYWSKRNCFWIDFFNVRYYDNYLHAVLRFGRKKPPINQNESLEVKIGKK